MNETIEALVQAHVRHEMESFRGEALTRLIEQEVSRTFDWLASVRLDEVASRTQVFGVIERYVTQFRISGGITELAGEMAHKILSSRWSVETRLDEIVPSEWYEDVVAKVVGLRRARGEVLQLVARSSAYSTLVARVLEATIVDFLSGWDNTAARRSLRLLGGVGLRLVGHLAPGFVKFVGTHFARYCEKNAERIARESEPHLFELLDEKRIRRTADEIWEKLSPMRLADAFAHIGDHDLEDFIVIGYEFWLKYRKTDYFREVSRELVDHFFDKYGDQSVLCLIEDMGVSKDMVTREIQVFVTPVIENAIATGFLERRIRARLEPFYASDALAAILAK